MDNVSSLVSLNVRQDGGNIICAGQQIGVVQ